METQMIQVHCRGHSWSLIKTNHLFLSKMYLFSSFFIIFFQIELPFLWHSNSSFMKVYESFRIIIIHNPILCWFLPRKSLICIRCILSQMKSVACRLLLIGSICHLKIPKWLFIHPEDAWSYKTMQHNQWKHSWRPRS